MDKMRQKHVDEMNRIKAALEKTESEYLRRDYAKAYRRMARELKEYDGYRNQNKS